MLVMLDETGNVITLDGRLAVNEDREGQVGVFGPSGIEDNCISKFLQKKKQEKNVCDICIYK